MSLPRRRFLGVDFTPLPLEEAARLISRRPASAPFAYVVTPNAHHMVRTHAGDLRFLVPYLGAWMVLNDSRILRLIARRLFGRDLPLAAGSDLTAQLFSLGIPKRTPIVIIGADEEVEKRLRRDFGLTRISRHTPPMGFYRDPVEVERCVAFVRDHPARYVFFVVGAPQSEMLAARVVAFGGVKGVGLCVGSSLHFLTGVTRRAPAVWRHANLEWAYRLLQNPVGHADRVLKQSAPILWIALRERLRV